MEILVGIAHGMAGATLLFVIILARKVRRLEDCLANPNWVVVDTHGAIVTRADGHVRLDDIPLGKVRKKELHE